MGSICYELAPFFSLLANLISNIRLILMNGAKTSNEKHEDAVMAYILGNKTSKRSYKSAGM